MSSPRGGTEVDQWRGEGKEDERDAKECELDLVVMTVRCDVSE